VRFVFDHEYLILKRSPTLGTFDSDLTFETSGCGKVGQHLTRLLRIFHTVKDLTSQINQGIWFLLGWSWSSGGACLTILPMPLTERVECIRSMYVFLMVLSLSRKSRSWRNCFYMWWDLLASSLCQPALSQNSVLTEFLSYWNPKIHYLALRNNIPPNEL